ncbi:MAG: hypothetical protein WDM92_03805 [Caulobacteraceae bacterium]
MAHDPETSSPGRLRAGPYQLILVPLAAALLLLFAFTAVGFHYVFGPPPPAAAASTAP